MANLNIDTFIAATNSVFLSTGDRIKKPLFVTLLLDAGTDAKVANQVWSMMNKSGRIQKGLVVDLTDSFIAPNTVEIVRSVLLSLQPDGGLTDALLTALYKVTGLSDNTIQSALNALENEYFLEQRRAVSPAQYIPRRWAA